MEKYRILSLDGGGSWSLLQVMALQALYGEKEKGHEVLKRFDLVAASGGGAITLVGLAKNMTLDQVLAHFFIDDGRRAKIFGATGDGWIKAAGLFRLEALRDILGPHSRDTLGSLYGKVRQSVGHCPDFLIGAFDCDRRRPEFFRSDLGSPSASSTGSWDPSVAEVIHAAATSPVNNFKALARINGTRFCDSAVAGLNNLIMAAVTEARANRREAKDMQVLSLGCGTLLRSAAEGEDRSWRKEKANGDAFLQSIEHCTFDDPPDSATYIAHVMLDQDLPSAVNQPPIKTGAVVRMSPALPVGTDGNPVAGPLSAENLKLLSRLNKCSVSAADVKLVKQMGDFWIAGKLQNEAIRATRKFKCEIGHETFVEAKQAWQKLTNEPSANQPAVAA